MFKTIKAKVLLLSLGLTFFTLLIFSISVYFDYRKEKINNYSIELLKLESLFLKDAKTIKDFIIFDLNDPIFFYTKNSIHFEEHKIYASGAKNKLQYLLSVEAQENDKLKYIYNRYSGLIINIDTLFSLGSRNGLMRKTIKNETNQLAELLKRKDVINFQIISQFLRYENDFQTFRDKTSFHKLINHLDLIIKKVDQNGVIKKKEKKDLLTRFNYYLENIELLHKMDMQIGVDINEGLKGQIDGVILELLSITKKQNEVISNKKNGLTKNFRLIFLIVSLLVFISSIIISIHFSKNNADRLSDLTNHITKFIKSKYTYRVPLFVKHKNDEIGQLIKSYHILQNNLIDHINNLEEIVKKRTAKIESQKNCITKQKEELLSKHDELFSEKIKVEKQNESIVFSINYAKRIQEALLEGPEYLNSIIHGGFIIYEPRDIVSGDFYWIKHINTGAKKLTYIAAADCTGHGVPGAFMSMLGISFLNDILMQKELTSASGILDILSEKFILSLSGGKGRAISDGLDIAMCIYDHNSETLQYAGANRPLYMVRNNILIEYKPDIMPIGKYYKEFSNFTNIEIEIKPGDKIYLFTDGISDQFDERDRKKYTRKKLKELLQEISYFPLSHQFDLVKNEFLSWKGKNQQTDDVLFIGFQLIPDYSELKPINSKKQFNYV